MSRREEKAGQVLRNKSDRRTLLWVLVPALLVGAQYANPSLVPYLAWLSAYFALACGVIAHNHNHCPTFSSKRSNQFFANWISVFYGYPTFAWIPTHNLNHHKYLNAEGDDTKTWRHTNRHNVFVAASYFFVSSYYQSGPIQQFITGAKAKNPRFYRTIMTQYAIWGGAHLSMLALGIALYGLKEGALLWVYSMALPALFALWTIMLFNYDQHAHTDPFSKYDHSRSFSSPVLNFLLFNNGYHYVHHEHPGAHWSTLKALHAEVAPHINPVLIQKSVWWYWFKQYALTPFFPSLGTVQLGPGPMHPPTSHAQTAAVLEAGASHHPEFTRARS